MTTILKQIKLKPLKERRKQEQVKKIAIGNGFLYPELKCF
jgi:hypothetical protein